MAQLEQHLKDLIDEASAKLPYVTTRRMFGCDGWFAKDHVYALVWDGRVLLRVPDDAKNTALLSMRGASPWAPMAHAKAMAHWVVVSESLHDDDEALFEWVRVAHGLNVVLPPKVKKAKAKAKPAKPAATKRAKRKSS